MIRFEFSAFNRCTPFLFRELIENEYGMNQ